MKTPNGPAEYDDNFCVMEREGASWGCDSIDIVALGLDQGGWHEAWAQDWWPSPAWEFLGGPFTSPPAVCSWRPARLDIIALGLDQGGWHEAWAQDWWPSLDGWELLGTRFSGAPSVVSWEPEGLDTFAVGAEASHLQNDAVCQ